MSVEHLAVVLHHSQARGTEKLVLLGIANHEGDGGAWPSISTLATYANVTERRVQQAIGKLVDLGELKRDVQAGGLANLPDHLRPNRFEVVVSCPEDCDKSPQHRVKYPTPGETRFTPPVKPASPEPVKPASPEPSLRTTRGTTSASLRSAGAQTTIDGTPEPPPKPTTAQDLVGEFIDHCKRRPPDRYLGKLAKATKELLDEGFVPDDIRAGMRVLIDKGLDASVLPSAVHGAVNAQPDRRPGRAAAESSAIWRYYETRCADCDGPVRINTATNQPDEPHVCPPA
jgi:hypothetical protein